MGWADRVTAMVVGKALTDQLDKARLEKHYEGVEQRLKETTSVSCEPREEIPRYPRRSYALERTESISLELPREGTLRPKRPHIQRSRSEIPGTIRPSFKSPSGPPDITAIDLSEDQIQRTYSQTDVWDSKKCGMPPLQEMTGFGKYRRSVHADAEWQRKQYYSNLGDLPAMVSQLGDFQLAQPDPVLWNQFVNESARTHSFASSTTSHSTSSGGPTDGIVDPKTNIRVVRGFVPSNSSSATSSFKDSSSFHIRKDSGLSIKNPSGEADVKISRYSSRQSALSLRGEPTALTCIREDLVSDLHHPRKSSQFLPCDMAGDTEIAVESDDEYEDVITFAVPRGYGVNTSATGALATDYQNATQEAQARNLNLERAKDLEATLEKARHTKHGLDRSATVRRHVKVGLRRANSRGKPHVVKRTVSSENAPLPTKQIQPTLNKPQHSGQFTLDSSDEAAEADENPGALPTPLIATGKQSKPFQQKDRDGSVGSSQSGSTVRTTTSATTIRTNPVSTAPRGRRPRSCTAVRIISKEKQVEMCSEADADRKRRVATK